MNEGHAKMKDVPETMPDAVPVTLTEAAARAVQARAQREGKEGQTLRLFVMGGGCSGVTYRIDFDAVGAQGTDFSFSQHGISIAIDPKSLEFLRGSVLDYKAELMSQRFIWSNPNAKSSCGCGESFGV